MRTKGELKKAFPKLNQLIDSLWRNYYGLYAERYRDPADLDGSGDPIDEWQKNFISRDIRHGQALGQNNLVEGNRSIAIGQSNNTKSFLEIVCGVYATAPESNATEWVPADRLFTVGNGLGPSLRNDALTIYKSGYSVFTNSILVGDYDHRDEVGFLIDPENGTLRFTTAEKYQFWDVDHWANLGGAGSYTLPVATTTILGGVKQGSGTTIAVDGTISVSTNYQAPLSGTGFVKISGTTISYDNSTYLTAITKAMVEAVLTGLITSHTHNYDKYSKWDVQTSYGTTGVFSGSIVEFAAGSGITISDNLNAGHQILTFSAPGGTMVYPGAGLAKSTGSAWAASITDNSSNWNTAYGWGNHAGLYAPIAHVGATGTAHGNATALVAGFMTASDFTKLEGIETGATNYSFNIQANSGTTAAIAKGNTVTFSQGSNMSISRTGNTITFSASYAPSMIYPSAGIAVSAGSSWGTSIVDNSANWNEAYSNMGKVAFHDNFTLIGYLNSSNFSIAGGVISLKLKTINSTSLIGIGDLSLQPTLSSGTNIKTINGNSILGSGDITITGGTNYWQQGTGYIAPATLADEVRIGSITDLGDYKLQVSGGIRNQDAFYTDGVITLIHHENTTSPNRVINLHATATQGWSYSRECAIGFNTPPTASSDATIESGLFTNYLNTATAGSRTSYFKWYVLHNDALTNTMTLNNLGDLSVTGKLTAVSTILSSGGAIGYAAGAGSTASQGTSKATAVTCNALCGDITTFSAALAAAAEATFTVNNNKVLAGDIILVNHVSGGTNGAYLVSVTSVAAGSFSITYSNVSSASKTEAPIFRFAIFRAVTA